jgi:hypothetical protein
MSTTDTSRWPKLEQPDTSNATYIDWLNYEGKKNYDPDQTWEDDRYPRRYEDYYQKLDEYNNGYMNYDWRNKNYYGWLKNDRLISSISGQLELTVNERAKAKGLYHQLPLGKFRGFLEDIAVALCFYVIEYDTKDKRRGHPNLIEDWQYDLIEQTFGVSKAKILTNYAKVESRVRTERLQKAPQHDMYRNSEGRLPDSTTVEYEQMSEQEGIDI